MEATEQPTAPPSPAPGFGAGFRAPFRGARFVYLQHPGLARYWLPPVLITLVALVCLGAMVMGAGDELLGALWAPPEGGVARFFHALLVWVLRGLLFAAGVVLVALLSGLVAAPFNDALSQAVEGKLTGDKAADPGLRGLVADLGRTMQLELRKLGIYLAVMVPAALASLLLPGLGPPIYSLLGFLFTVLYFALDYVDWPAARRGWSARMRLGLLRGRAAPMFGFGLGVWVFLWVPLVNLLFMPAAVAGGTMLFLDLYPGAPPGPGPEPARTRAV